MLTFFTSDLDLKPCKAHILTKTNKHVNNKSYVSNNSQKN